MLKLSKCFILAEGRPSDILIISTQEVLAKILLSFIKNLFKLTKFYTIGKEKEVNSHMLFFRKYDMKDIITLPNNLL